MSTATSVYSVRSSLLQELRRNDRPAFDLIVSLYNLNCINLLELKKLRALAVNEIVSLQEVKEELKKCVSDELGINMVIAFLDILGDQTTTAERLVLLIDVLYSYNARKIKLKPKLDTIVEIIR